MGIHDLTNTSESTRTNKFIETIEKMLDDVTNAHGLENKARIAEELLTIIDQNQWFLNSKPTFKIAVSKKLKEFEKTNCPHSQNIAKKFRHLM